MMDRNIKVSVLMLAYNQEQYVDEAIRSVVLQQTDFDYELLIADDGSSDATADRCRQWQQRYPDRIRLLGYADNVGLARNYVRLYAEATGQYIAVCEADDFWADAHKLQIQADYLDAHPDCALCFHRVVNYYEADGSKSLSNGGQKPTLTLREVALCNPITNVSVCYRRGVIGALPSWMDQVTSYDLVMHLLALRHGTAHYMTRPMAVYRKLATSIWTGGDRDRRAMISRKNRDLLIGYFESRDAQVCAILRRANALNCLDMANYYAAAGRLQTSDDYLRLCRSYEPAWTDGDIAAHRQQLMCSQRIPLLRRCLSSVRRYVSMILPLPKIR